MSDCSFCAIVAGESEAAAHPAFLTRWPNSTGMTVVIPKDHHPSYFAEVNPMVRHALTDAAATVASQLDRAIEGVGRTALVYEGFGIDHLHAKLIPLHQTEQSEWEPIASESKQVHPRYVGYVTSNDGPEVPFKELQTLAKQIREAA